MYLNVSLTPPPSASEGGSCSTPKTPEILNSIMSLTSPPLPPTYSHYQNQVGTGDLLSPASSISSPCEEIAATQFGQPGPTSGAPSISKVSAGAFILSRPRTLSGGTAGTPSSTGTPSPPVPELPSPVNTVEATKSALIKEGLKHQIRSKLKAAGIDQVDALPEIKEIKEEKSFENELTMEDEERRRRRRERNKIAATKCRNKKKERTCILLSESDVVEDQNLRLKSEIKRLEMERLQLEKILRDPSHKASCRHTRRNKDVPLVIVTPPEAPDTTSPPSASGLSPTSFTPKSTSISTSSSSPSTSNVPVNCEAGHSGVSYCPTTVSPSESYGYDNPYPCEPPNLISYNPTESPSSTLSDAFTTLSPPKIEVRDTSCLPNTAYSVHDSGNTLVASSHSPYVPACETISHSYAKEGRGIPPLSNTLVPKHSLTYSKRHMPYEVIRHSNEGSVIYSPNKCANELDHPKEGELECYLPVTTEEEKIQGSLYMYPHQSPMTERHYTMDSRKDSYPTMKTRSQSRYAPYKASTPLLTDVTQEIADNYYQGSYSQNTANHMYSDATQSQFYSQCNF